MKTPIFDFVEQYAKSDASRFHMPGHKGVSYLGCEARDVTEIAGADTLSVADGIIGESEENASALFETAHSFYSTEGSTLCIKAMLAAVTAGARKTVSQPLILAARNAHKAFLYASALLDLRVQWLMGEAQDHLCRCTVSPAAVENALQALEQAKDLPSAVYLTSPDYLGNVADLPQIAQICHAHGIPLLVDNAHGAYLQFLTPSRHPIALGADLCCDSAHKTLPVLTGGAYLHVSKNAPVALLSSMRRQMALFASTSPSYLILQSLDLCNAYLADGYREKLNACIGQIDRVKRAIAAYGFPCDETEPLKLVWNAPKFGYRGESLADHLRLHGIEVEFADAEYLVLMATPETRDVDYDRLIAAFSALRPKEPLAENTPPAPEAAEVACSIRTAMLAESETVSIHQAEGRICASPTVSCPPAVPILISGERITPHAISLLAHYGQEQVEVVREI